MCAQRCVEVALKIPDNEAETALATLRRLGLDLGDLRRADVYRLELEDRCADETLDALRSVETIFNPNKHRLSLRSQTEPAAGEAWIDEPGFEPSITGGGNALRGIKRIERFTAWQLFDAQGNPERPETVTRANELLLCNPAFQRALIGR
jgi:phosphoribosylformylglycinamidine (FGAM) synthase PurS component